MARAVKLNWSEYSPLFANFPVFLRILQLLLLLNGKLRKIARMNSENHSKPITGRTPIRFSDSLPEEVDVVVIGAGVAGIFAALYMVQDGLKVLVCEKGRVAAEQSSRNWGWIRQHGRDEAELPIMMEASRLWEEADKAVNGATGFHRGGVCYLASTPERLETRERWVSVAQGHGLDTRMMSASEIATLIDRSGQEGAIPWIAGCYTQSDARAEPWKAIPAIAKLLRDKGGLIRENCAVRALDIEAAKVTGVVTESGTIKCQQVVVAGGAWSSLFLKRHGISIPQLSVRSTVARTAPLPEVFSGNAADEKLAFRRREDGGYIIAGGGTHDLYVGPDAFRHLRQYLQVWKANMDDTSIKLWPRTGMPDSWTAKRNWAEDEASPFEETRVLDPEPNLNQVERTRISFAERFPGFGKPEILNAWAGMIDTMPDIVPVVDRAPDVVGLIISTGFSGHGFGIGPGFGRIVANMAQEKAVGHDMTRFRFGRFTDGSTIMPGPSI